MGLKRIEFPPILERFEFLAWSYHPCARRLLPRNTISYF